MGREEEGEGKSRRKGIDIWKIVSGRLCYYLPIYPVGFWVYSNPRRGIAKAIDQEVRSAVPFVTVGVEGAQAERKMEHLLDEVAEVFFVSIKYFIK